MEHLDGIHYERFYRNLITDKEASLIFESIEGETEGGETETYYCFDDATNDAYHDGATLAEYGNAFYFKKGKIYQCVIYFENAECCGVNLYSDPTEIKDFVQDLLRIADGDETDPFISENPWTEDYVAELKEDNLLSKTTESLLNDLDKYGFSALGVILHNKIDEVGPEATGKAISQMVEEEMHYNLQTGIKHLYDKCGKDDEYFKKMYNLTDNFIETYIQVYNNRLPKLEKHIANRAEQNFGEPGALWAKENGYNGYLVKDPEDWAKLKGPVGLAIHLCGCKNFDQVIENESQQEFIKHFINIFFFTLKEIGKLPSFYRENLKTMLVTSIEALYHDDELDWGLEKEEGILTHCLSAWLDSEYGLDFDDYITEDQVPISYSGEKLALFGVNGIDSIGYPVDYNKMANDLLDNISENNNYESATKSEEKQVFHMKFKGNFGTLNLTVESDGNVIGQYQNGGTLEGKFKDDEFIGEWRNKDMEGLVNFTVADGKLNGSWKKGLDKGAMRGKWEGEQIGVQSQEDIKKNEMKKKDLVIFGYDMIGDSNPWDAPEVELWIGEYKNSNFILGRIYEGEYEGDDGETYYNSFYWEFHEAPKDEKNKRVDESLIVELIDYMDYDSDFQDSKWEEVVSSIT